MREKKEKFITTAPTKMQHNQAYDEFIEAANMVFNNILNHFNTTYGYYRFRKTQGKKSYTLQLSTGGWSENETVLDEIEGTTYFYNFWLEEYKRGGHYKFEIPEFVISKEYLQELKLLHKHLHRKK